MTPERSFCSYSVSSHFVRYNLYSWCRYKKVGSVFQTSSAVSSVSPTMQLEFANLSKWEIPGVYWIKLWPLLIDLGTSWKFTAAVNHKKIHLLLKDQYIVSTGLRGCFFDWLFVFVNRSVSTNLSAGCQWWKENRAAAKQKFNKFAAIFHRISLDFFPQASTMQHHIPCVCSQLNENVPSQKQRIRN